jgi:methyl-accepting chemotaxis protein
VGKQSSEKCSSSFTSIHSNITEIVPMIEMIKKTSELQKASLLETQTIFETLQSTNTQMQEAFSQLVRALPQLVTEEAYLADNVQDLTLTKNNYEHQAS